MTDLVSLRLDPDIRKRLDALAVATERSRAAIAAEADYQFFRDAIVEAAGRFGLAIHAYVWMTNHIHLLATPTDKDSIGKTFQSVGRKYVQQNNR